MDTQALVDEIVERVKRVRGLRAIVLGGSRARGTHTDQSDIDLGLYYHPQEPLDLEHLSRVASALDDTHPAQIVTSIGGWGPHINGGGWLTVRGQAVDFLYRDLRHVEQVIDACTAGQVEIAYQPGHPHGFVSAIYMAEVAQCQVLWEADGGLSALKARTAPYPPALKAALLSTFAWEIDFALTTARKGIAHHDLAYVAGSCFRSVMCMAQVLFALNEHYWMNEKGSVALADTFPLRPPEFRARVDRALALLRADPASLEAAIDGLGAVSKEVAQLVCEHRGG